MKQITCPHCGDTYPDFDVAHVCSKGPYAPRLKPKMNERIKLLAEQAGLKWKAQPPHYTNTNNPIDFPVSANRDLEKFAELIVRECLNREELLGAIARGWCSEKNSHKTMDPDLAVAIFDEVEQQIRQQFGVE